MYQSGLPLSAGEVTFDIDSDQSRFVLRGRHSDQLEYVDTKKSRNKTLSFVPTNKWLLVL